MTFFLFCAHYWKKGDGHRGNVHGLALLLVWFHGFASHVLCICSFSFFVLLSFLGCSSMFSHLLGHLLSYYQKVSRRALHRNINSSHLCHKAPATCSGTRSWLSFTLPLSIFVRVLFKFCLMLFSEACTSLECLCLCYNNQSKCSKFSFSLS